MQTVLHHRNGLTVGDISLWEINEAFAVVVLANCHLLGLDVANVNIHGGAIAVSGIFGFNKKFRSDVRHFKRLGTRSECRGRGSRTIWCSASSPASWAWPRSATEGAGRAAFWCSGCDQCQRLCSRAECRHLLSNIYSSCTCLCSVCGNKFSLSRLVTVTRLVRSGGLLRHLLDHGELLPLRHRRVGGAAAAAGRVRQALKPEPITFPFIKTSML